MKYKKKNGGHRLWRKMGKQTKSLGEWSRMLHLWWKRDVYSKYFTNWKND